MAGRARSRATSAPTASAPCGSTTPARRTPTTTTATSATAPKPSQVATGPLPSGVTWVTVSVGCDGGPGGYSCPGSQGPLPEADAVILGADFAIASTATPTASGFSGTLLAANAHGTADLAFTATDPDGPGVYNVTVHDRRQHRLRRHAEHQRGRCAQPSAPTRDGRARCSTASSPARRPRRVDIPSTRPTLADGQHDLKVIVTDAAQNSSTVLDQTITTAEQHDRQLAAALTSPQRPPRPSTRSRSTRRPSG